MGVSAVALRDFAQDHDLGQPRADVVVEVARDTGTHLLEAQKVGHAVAVNYIEDRQRDRDDRDQEWPGLPEVGSTTKRTEAGGPGALPRLRTLKMYLPGRRLL